MTAKSYEYIDLERDWQQAEDYCVNTYGTHLASIRNNEDYNAFGTLSGFSHVWLGLNDKDGNGWEWSDGTVCQNNDCKTLSWWDRAPGNWNCGMKSGMDGFLDEPCNNQYHFLCNTPIATAQPTTAIPTTFAPTTTTPTTVIPTTAVPTTAVPTTVTPTTVTPTTNMPTTSQPTFQPTIQPSISPSKQPSFNPTTYAPTNNPTHSPISEAEQQQQTTMNTMLTNDNLAIDSNGNDWMMVIVMGTVASVIAFVVIVLALILFCRKRANKRKNKDTIEMANEMNINRISSVSAVNSDCDVLENICNTQTTGEQNKEPIRMYEGKNNNNGTVNEGNSNDISDEDQLYSDEINDTPQTQGKTPNDFGNTKGAIETIETQKNIVTDIGIDDDDGSVNDDSYDKMYELENRTQDGMYKDKTVE